MKLSGGEMAFYRIKICSCELTPHNNLLNIKPKISINILLFPLAYFIKDIKALKNIGVLENSSERNFNFNSSITLTNTSLQQF